MEKRDERTSKAQHHGGANESSTRRPWSRPTLVRLSGREAGTGNQQTINTDQHTTTYS